MKSQVADQLIDTFQFQDKQQQQLFEILTSVIKLPPKPFTERDLKVDLVLKMQVPQQDYTLKSNQTPYDLIFKNTSPIYEEMYSLVQQYIAYLVEHSKESKEAANPLIRKMTSLKAIEAFAKQRRLLLKDSSQRFIDIDCSHQYLGKIDTFTLEYNMIMLILQKICKFQVKTFLLQEKDPKNSYKTRLNIYFLLSLSTQDLMKTADKYKVKKQISMVNLDFIINQPIDSAGRPIRINSFFKGTSSNSKGFYEEVKKLNRDLGLSNKAFSEQIIDEVYLSQDQIHKYEMYFLQLQQYVNKIMLSKIPKQLEGHSKTTSQQQRKQHWLYQKFPKRQGGLSKYERQYLYIHNRQKINKGCQEYLVKMKKKKQVYGKIVQLNEKYGYAVNSYEDTFVQFVLPGKKKTFFEKLAHILNYQSYKNTPYDDISLFTPMQRIKIAFLKISQVFKVQNFKKKGLMIYAINNQYQKFGDIRHQFNQQQLQQQDQKALLEKAIEQKKRKCLQKQWHPFLAFKTNIRVVRDYMGDSFAFQLAFKIHMITYLLIMSGAAIGFQIGLQMFYETGVNNQKQYIYSLAQLIVLFCSYVFLIQLWKKKQSKYLNNYVEHNIKEETRSTYSGPYVRNLINDSVNTFQSQKNLQFSIRENIALIVLCLILVIQGLWFWGIRKLITANYLMFPTIYLISTCHLSFYCLFFAANYCLYLLVFRRLLQKMVQFINYAKTEQHNNSHRRLINIYNFGLELIGPLYLMVIEVFNGTSCHAASCISQFQYYIISRYLITIGIVMIKNVIFLYRISRMYIKNKAHKDYIKEYQMQSNMFQFKLNQLLRHIQFQSEKIEVQLTVRQQMIIFFFYSIFFIRFPFGEVFSLLTLTLNYCTKRLQVLYLNKRPIPSNSQLYKYSEVIQRLYFISVLVNSWAIFFNYKFIQYELRSLLSTFLTTINLQNILTFKLLGMVVLFVGFLVASEIFKKIASFFGQQPIFQERKMNKFKQFLINAKGKPQSKSHLRNLAIIKTIFRTFSLQFVIDYKKNKFNFLKQKLRPAAPAQLSLRQKTIVRKSQHQEYKSKMNITQIANTQTQIINREVL